MNQEQEPNKIALTSPDGREARLKELRRLFPDLFDGEGVLDEKALRQLVAEEVGRVTERFRFEWAGKAQSKRFAFAPSKATLVYDPERSVDADGTPNTAGQTLADNTSQNLIIEGDNLEVLKLLQASYFERVKCIYIDPPYNTGNDFIYPDDFSDNLKAYWQKNGTVKEGIRLRAVGEAAGKVHSNWLNMMQARLALARNLLREDGVIFVSIDDHEMHNLRQLLNEVLGEENFLGVVCRATGQTTGQDSGGLGSSFDFLLAYGKDATFDLSGIPLTPKDLKRFENEDDRGKYAYDQMRKTGSNDRREDRPNLFYPVQDPDGGDVLPIAPAGYESTWRFDKKAYDRLLKDNYILWKKTKRGDDEIWWPYVKYYLEGRTKRPSPLWNDLDGNKKAARDLRTLFGGVKVFDFPKPVPMIERCIHIAPNASDDDIIMDFFAGSGATAEAVMKINAQDNGNRKYVLVQVPEFTEEKTEAYKAGYKKISDITFERAKRAGDKIRDEYSSASVDTGYRALKLTYSHFSQNTFTPDPEKSEAENIKALEDHLAAAAQLRLFGEDEFHGVVTEIALKNGFGLFYSLERFDAFTTNAVYRLTGNDKSAILCLDGQLDGATIEALKDHSDDQLIVLKVALDTTKKFELQTAFQDNLWVV